MPCGDYNNRPKLCREFTCGTIPCELCDDCCTNVVIAHGGTCPEQDAIFFKLHGLKIEQAVDGYTIHIPMPCERIAPRGGVYAEEER